MNLKQIAAAVVLLFTAIAIYIFTRPENKDTNTTTSTNVNTGLSSLNLGNLLGSLFGSNSGVQSQDSSYVSPPRSGSAEGPGRA